MAKITATHLTPLRSTSVVQVFSGSTPWNGIFTIQRGQITIK